MLLAEFGSGQVLWSLVWLTLFVMWFFLVVTIFTDIMRSDTLSGLGKAMWAIGIIIVPFLGILMYLIVEGSSIARRTGDPAPAPTPAPTTAGGGPAAQLEQLAARHRAGELSDDEYAAAKAAVIG